MNIKPSAIDVYLARTAARRADGRVLPPDSPRAQRRPKTHTSRDRGKGPL